ncbi:class I SAM-dependent methyltransferase [Leptothermofonsia sp. ETS-13]|uniref:class I SAM-dependent methyltransferase n=1 Tax=Leptothermofonsia sp. ETS-13 TaxID=3035696 RepID=UPI003B9FC361
MVQRLTRVLSIPTLYRLLQYTIAGPSAYEDLVHDYIRPKSGDRILDIGCGPAYILHYMPAVDYVGFDENPRYIAFAQSKLGDRGTFYCNRVNAASLQTLGQEESFDLVLAIAILHHLDDDEAIQLFQLARKALKPGGRFVSIDSCYVKQQSPIARFIISMDRGRYVRQEQEYVKLASNVFSSITVDIRHDRLRIPYTHIILECVK